MSMLSVHILIDDGCIQIVRHYLTVHYKQDVMYPRCFRQVHVEQQYEHMLVCRIVLHI